MRRCHNSNTGSVLRAPHSASTPVPSEAKTPPPSTNPTIRLSVFGAPLSVPKTVTTKTKPTTTPSEVRRFLINDIDTVTIGARKKNPHEFLSKATDALLSPDILQRTREVKYDGFIPCTHRSYETDRLNIKAHIEQYDAILNYTNNLKKKAAEANLSPLEFFNQTKDKYDDIVETYPDLSETNFDNEFISKVVENMWIKTGLPCLAVSTPDDNADPEYKCGSGYKANIERYEAMVLKTKKVLRSEEGAITTKFDFAPGDFKIEQKAMSFFYIDENSKNAQLIKIAQHLRDLYPYATVIDLDFIDDKQNILNTACRLAPNLLPAGVRLHIYHHDTYTGTPINDASKLGCITGTKTSTQATESKSPTPTTSSSSSPATVTLRT